MKKACRGINRSLAGWLFIAPALIFFIFFIFTPIILGFFYSFTDYEGLTNKFDFVGLENFHDMFADRYFKTALKNNIIYGVLMSVCTMLLSLVLAVLVNASGRLKSYFKIAFFLPYVTSMVSVAIIWKMIFNPMGGPLNVLLNALGVENPPSWLSSSTWALYAVIIVSIWKDCGYYMLIFIAGLQNIPEDLYEAASLDGASRIRSFFGITIPMLSPTIFLNCVIVTINSFQAFDLINVMTGGGPGMSTNVLSFRIYTEAFVYGKMGYASAIAYFLFALILILTLIQFRFQKRWVNYA